MKCYLAKTEDLVKIANFINQQPKTTLGRDCIEISLKKVQETMITADTLKKMCDSRQGYEIFVCEDDLGNIKYIHGRERRGKDFNANEPEIVVGGDGVIFGADFEKKDFTYRTELWDWIVKYQYNTYGTNYGEYNVPKDELDFIKGFFGDDTITIKKETTIPATAEYPVRYVSFIGIDFEKWLKKIGYIK